MARRLRTSAKTMPASRGRAVHVGIGQRVNRSTRLETQQRHRSTVSGADQANPGSDAQLSLGQCNFGCNLPSDSAAFAWTGQTACLVQVKIASAAPSLLGFAIYIWTIPALVVQI
jgi:hypothetical protein